MPDLIPPHGGLTEPLDLQVSAAEQADFRTRAAALKKVPLSDADLSTLYRLGDGGLSPLTGPMDRKTWDRVLNEEVLEHNGKKYARTIPLAFPVDAATAGSLKVGETVALVNSQAAQRKFDELKGELLIKPVKIGFAAFYEELGRVGLVDEHGPKGFKQVNISGRDLREKLRKGELPDPRVTRPETARILIESMKGK